MLKNTFHHIPGIGIKSEQKLWNNGVMSWKDIENPEIKIPAGQRSKLKTHIKDSMEQIENGNFNYFENLLPSGLHWRFFPEVRKNAVYLDIETTGMESYDKITTIALFNGKEIQYFVNGKNMEQFPEALFQYSTIITYNGKCFDIPFIEKYFRLSIPHVHIDLRYLLKSLGYDGGLKGCEKKMGIRRGELDGVDGFFAVLLWSDYIRRKNIKALETLLAYNIEDVINLEILMVKAYNMKIMDTPFSASHSIPLPKAPDIPFRADPETIKRLKRHW
ncbi:conserved hypothetical protein [Desulfamplus magnetovallimortis]|uniref:YprB ribonuclease H-like domain-containing protein n=1 Tax=Desulfamplus magnetovallimortis TaxID=1246637 RepID=A0A1W1HGI5_9BACT|nr:ribonuclease H-like domain-containing protein [Desulfamplus magnetovallimortis]SLM31505.1 conserved hypothetical protein [Desulfamplus magnetovallimortis]